MTEGWNGLDDPEAPQTPPLAAVETPIFEPSENVLVPLRSAMEAATNAEIVGIAGVAMYRNGTTEQFFGGEIGTATIGRLDLLKAKLIEELRK